MANTYPYETTQAVLALQSMDGNEDQTIIAPLNAWLGLDALNAPVDFHHWAISGDDEVVVISPQPSFFDWAISGVMDDNHMALAISSERSAGSRMAISDGMGRGITSAPVKAAWKATYRRR